MSALWTSAEAAGATGGSATGDWSARGVSIDTRTLRPGDLFVALTDVRDGHDFVADALAKGAAAAMVSRQPEGAPDDAPLLMVEDVLKGLVALGRAGRARAKARVVAVTGSAGKTSTKEMLRVVLERQGKTHAAEASYNNHWGVPLTLARMPADTEYAVIEIGMNRPGEIAPLSRMAAPHVAVVTTIAAAHLEAFDDLAGIAREKASIFEGLEAGGTAVVNADVGTAQVLRDIADRHAVRRIGFGEAEGADWSAKRIALHDGVTAVEAETPAGPCLYKVSAMGRHFALNALAAMAAAEALGADPAVAACDMALWTPPAGRGQRETVVLDEVEDTLRIDLIDDAFNANPASLAVALEVLAATNPMDGLGRVTRGRRIAILGDMLELGPTSEALHAEIATLPSAAQVDLFHCAGPLMRCFYDTLPAHKRGVWAETAEELVATARTLVDAGDIVLVKGSKGSRVSLVVDAIRKLGRAPVATAGESA
ncbi:MAG: UDP-N-acetylmuramoyl-tripeptide--D-alanyl-D-alanine ligase [Pseudomonadota bacterium]